MRRERREAVLYAMGKVESTLAGAPIDRERLTMIEAILRRLAARAELFSAEAFPPPADPTRDSNMYELCRDDRGETTLYVSVAPPGLETPPHDHGTWAVIAGVRGTEANVFYRRAPDGTLAATRTVLVEKDAAVSLMPKDLHSIRILPTPEPFFSFHLYGLPFERTRREYRDPATGEWKYFTARPNIRPYDLNG